MAQFHRLIAVGLSALAATITLSSCSTGTDGAATSASMTSSLSAASTTASPVGSTVVVSATPPSFSASRSSNELSLASPNSAAPAAGGQLAADSPYGLGVGGSAGFATPSGNIKCLMDPAGLDAGYPAAFSVVCYVQEHDWQTDSAPDASVCGEPYNWVPDYVALMSEGVSAGICASESPTYASKAVLPYGQSVTTGTITCTSADTGVTCHDSSLGSGFTVSRGSFTRDGSAPSWVGSNNGSALGSGGLGQFKGTWERHTSILEINADMTGSAMYGSGCCNSVEVPLTYAMSNDGQTLLGTVSGDATYTGDSFRDTQLPVGTGFRFHIEESEPYGGQPTGPVVVQDNPFGLEADLVWCGEFYDARCGA